MKKLVQGKHVFFAAKLLILVAIGVLLGLPLRGTPSSKLASYTASDVLGQTDFTSGYLNGVPPNDYGLNRGGGTANGIAVDSAHNRTFVSDTGNHRILIYNTTNITNGMAASYVLGQPDFAGQDPAAIASGLHDPQGVAYAPDSQRLFVADSFNNRILVFDLSGGITNGMAASYVLGQPDFTSSGASTNNHSFYKPDAVTYDTAAKRLFVRDDNNYRILVFDLSGGITNGMAASYVLGQPDLSSWSCSGIDTLYICGASGVSYDAVHQRLAVSTFNARVVIYDLSAGITNGMAASYVLGQSAPENNDVVTSQSGVSDVTDAQFDSTGTKLFVYDLGGNRVLVFDLSGGITNGMNASYVLGQTNFTNKDPQATPVPVSNGLSSPNATALDTAHHRLFVADYLNYRVLVYNLDSTNHLIDHTPDNVIGESDLTSANCTSDPNSTCFVTALAYDSVHNRLFVSGGFGDVLVFDLSGGITNGMNASYVLGRSGFGRSITNCPYSGTAAQATICSNSTLAYDPVDDRLFVADSGDYRILVFDLSGGITNGMNASYVLGQTDFTSAVSICTYNGTSPNAVNFCGVEAVTYDPVHQWLFVADSDYRILVFDLSGGITNGMAAQHVLGAANMTSSRACSTDRNAFCQIGALLYDPSSQYLFASNTVSARVVVFNLSNGIVDDMPASDVLGQPDFTTGTHHCMANAKSDVTASGFCYPGGLAYDGTNKVLYVADSLNNRVLTFNMQFAITDTTLPKAQTNQAYSASIPAMYGEGAFHFSVASGSLPTGLTLDSSTGEVTGTPTVNGDYTFTVGASDSAGHSDSKTMHLTVHTNVAILTTTLQDAQTGVAYAQDVSFAGMPSGSYVSSGSLPPGLSFDGSKITGTPTTEGDYSFTISVYDQSSSASGVVTIHVGQGPVTVLAQTLAKGAVNYPYNHQIEVLGGASPYTMTVTQGSLPTGIGLDTNGILSGTPTEVGSFTFTITATDSNATQGSRELTLDVLSHPSSYAASDLLGQVDGQGNPVWNSISDSYNSSYSGAGYGNPNDIGFSYNQGVTMDTVHHRLFVATCGYRVLVFNLDAHNNLLDRTADYVLGEPDFTTDSSSPPSASSLNCPVGPSYDPVHDRLFVPDNGNDRVMVYDLSGGITNGMDATYVLGQPDFTSNIGGPSQSVMGYPYGGSAYDSSTQYFYVSDSQNKRVLVYDLSGGITNGMDATYVLGQPDFTSNACAVTQSGLSYPYGLALDPTHHRLFVADDGYCYGSDLSARVLVYDITQLSNGMPAAYVLGQHDFTSFVDGNQPDPTPSPSLVLHPENVVYDDSHQRLFVYDDTLNRVLAFDLSRGIANGMNAQAVIGQQDFLSSNYDCIPSQITLCDSEGMSDYYDEANNRLYLSDASNNRVMIYEFIRFVTSVLNAGQTGVIYSQQLQTANSQGDVTYSVTSGSLPAGVVLDASTGTLSGTPTTHGDYTFTIQAKDDKGPSGYFTDSKTYTVAVTGDDLTPLAGGDQGGGQSDQGSNPISTVVSVVSKVVQVLTNPTADATSDGGSTAESVDLDTVPDFTASTGANNAYAATVQTGAILHFTLPFTTPAGTTKQNHTITVNTVHSDSVDITIASNPIHLTLGVGEQKLVDVDGDGKQDLGVRLLGIAGSAANLQVWRIAATTSRVVTPTTKQPSRPQHSYAAYLYGAASIVILGGGLYLLKRMRALS